MCSSMCILQLDHSWEVITCPYGELEDKLIEKGFCDLGGAFVLKQREVVTGEVLWTVWKSLTHLGESKCYFSNTHILRGKTKFNRGVTHLGGTTVVTLLLSNPKKKVIISTLIIPLIYYVYIALKCG